jgi:hypothetical protein
MTQFADELATSGTPLWDDELIAYLLAGLDEDYNPVFTAVVAQVDPISPSELYAQLLSFEQHTNLQAHNPSSGSSLAMAASRGRGYSGGRGTGGPSHGCGVTVVARSKGVSPTATTEPLAPPTTTLDRSVRSVLRLAIRLTTAGIASMKTTSLNLSVLLLPPLDRALITPGTPTRGQLTTSLGSSTS